MQGGLEFDQSKLFECLRRRPIVSHKKLFFELKPEDLEQGLTCDLGQFHMPDMTPQQPMHPNTKGDTLGTAIVPVGAVGNQVK